MLAGGRVRLLTPISGPTASFFFFTFTLKLVSACLAVLFSPIMGSGA